MNSSREQQTKADDSAIKDTKDWVSGDDPATPSQRSYLETLVEQAGEKTDIDAEKLTKAEASDEIDRLRKETGLD